MANFRFVFMFVLLAISGGCGRIADDYIRDDRQTAVDQTWKVELSEKTAAFPGVRVDIIFGGLGANSRKMSRDQKRMNVFVGEASRGERVFFVISRRDDEKSAPPRPCCDGENIRVLGGETDNAKTVAQPMTELVVGDAEMEKLWQFLLPAEGWCFYAIPIR